MTANWAVNCLSFATTPSATPRLNHFAVRVDMLSKIVLRERSSEGLETIEIVIHNTQHILHSKEIAMDA